MMDHYFEFSKLWPALRLTRFFYLYPISVNLLKRRKIVKLKGIIGNSLSHEGKFFYHDNLLLWGDKVLTI